MNWVWAWGARPPQLQAHPDRFSRRELTGLVLLVAVVFATRLPWLFAGYGIDPDCGRVIIAARHIARTGEYTVSRGPAYPVHEYMVAALERGGPALTNGLSALFSSVAALFLALILRRLGVRNFLVMPLAFAFVPVVFVNSVSTIDYVPALAFILMSTYFVLAGKPLLSGVSLGLAIGTRLTSGAMLLPLFLWACFEGAEGKRLRGAVSLCLATLIVGALAYLPAFLKHGTAFVAFVDWATYPEYEKVLQLGVNGVWGYSPGTVLAALIFLYFAGTLLAFQHRVSRSSWLALVLSALVVILYSVAYLRLPFEAGYLMPAVPFALLPLCLLYTPSWLRVTGLALAVAFLVAPGEHDPLKPWAILQDHRIRTERWETTQKIIHKVNQLPPGSVVVVAWEQPQIEVQLDGKVPDPNPYIYFIQSTEEFQQYQQAGRAVYYLHGLDWHNHNSLGVDLVALGAHELLLADSVAVAGGGT